MSERNTPQKEGGLNTPPKPEPSDAGLTKTGGEAPHEPRGAEDVELEDSPGGRDGGMIGEG